MQCKFYLMSGLISEIGIVNPSSHNDMELRACVIHTTNLVHLWDVGKVQ